MGVSVVRRLMTGGASLSLLALAGCGGGGGGGPRPTPAPPPVAPAPTPTPTPSPTPTPTPSSNGFATAEFNRSAGLAVANVLPAYQAGATGAGVTAGVIDSGIDVDSPEFAGRISPASADLVGNRGLQDEGGHGTAVSSVLLGAKNDLGTHGVAFGATLLVLRTDTPGSCANASAGDEGDCSHSDSAIARAVDLATAQNARVINISLGGSSMESTLRAAVGRATAAGVVIVISAGNDGNANPDLFAQVAGEPIARGQIIIAGSVDSGGSISSFSNRAGVKADVYLAALGERVRAPDETGREFFWDGTSFAAPHVAGAAALLAQAFPNLTGAQIVELLLSTANDAGAVGADPIYGRGVLNIGRAFQPQGQSSLAGSAAPVSLTVDNATLSAAMGDAGGEQLGAVILDGFDRAFAVDLAQSIRTAPPSMTLAASLQNEQRSLAAAGGGTMVALSIEPGNRSVSLDRLMLSGAEADRARAIAGMVSSRLGKNSSFAIGVAQSGVHLAAQLEGRADPAFLIARDTAGAVGFEKRSDSAFAFRHQIGRTGLWAAAEQGDALVYERGGLDAFQGRYRRHGYSSVAAGFDRSFGNVRLAGSATRLIEDETVLGARFGPAFGAGNARSWFVDLGASYALGDGWSIGGSTRQGLTKVGAGGALGRSAGLRTDAYAFDLGKTGLFDASDRWAFRVSQPLRVRSGGFDLSLPTGYDYRAGVTAYELQRLDLSPEGREIDVETSYARDLWGERMGAHLFYRNDPGNYEAMPDDIGAAIRFSLGF